ncbi:MAG TPA: signal peptide peptidase SppA [Polyangiaceae bacterium]|nr:signal peptide peptidase SppA [Polyangiaceae bacterium]
MRSRSVLGWAAFVAFTCISGAAFAQAAAARPTPLPAYGRSVAGTDDSTALVVNPANLAFLPSAELRWSSLYLDEAALLPWQGHAFSFALPLPFSLATGVRVDIVDPPSTLAGLSPPFRANYEWFTWGLALRASDTTSLGLSYKHSTSEARIIDDIDSWSFGFSTRPSELLGISAVAHDLGNPESRTGYELGASYDLALALRPFSSRAVELGLEGRYVSEDSGYWVPRATLGVDIPELGRLRGEFAMQDPTNDLNRRAWLASAQMSFAFNGVSGSMEFGAGSVFGNALGSEAKGQAHENLAIDVAFRGFREPAAAPSPAYALRIRLENTPDARGHVALLRRLWSIAERESSVAAVVLELRASPAKSMAHVQELRDAVHFLRMSGKSVLCHIEDGDGSALYLCSAANRILVSPGGGLRFAGLKARYLYYRSLLDKLGIHADFVRIGAHKSAPEAFMQDASSETAREDKIDLLQQFERQLTLGVAAGRKIEPLELRRRIALGPFIAEEAKQQGFVDGLAFDDEVEKGVADMLGGHVNLVDDKRAPIAPTHFGATRGIAVIYVDGDMVDGRSQVIPLVGMRLVGSYTIAETVKQARDNPMVGAVVLRVESGGGSALAADVIWREVELTSKVKPVIVSMGATAASAAYYIAAPATRIYANPLTITGSIGVFYGKADVSELLRRIGVSVEVYKTAPRADAESLYRPFTAEEKVELQRKVGQFYAQFLARVSAGRKLTPAQVDAVGQGQVWTGEQALSRKLIDELGGLRQALNQARLLADLPDYAPIVELPPPEGTWIGRALGIDGLHADASAGIALPPELLSLAQALAPFVIHPADKPMARLEITDVGP